ncbi:MULTISPECIES: nucleoside triphosphate pyrophosphohydrolase family protein [Xanthomonas]|uniref:nucleoside triphosphate pyrophosphohydrolase family protein n=1 Tax=Xanthomonas TaxID=338 RepID=UPI001369F655|nr:MULTISPECIES: nucleoside triphosphate pyrophosphohydrolase family protein [Xanthomonas]MBB4767679.1 NTP pyrophosphatase (non-canonical NTP hydrolase) [Xanthomonas arboricola]
MTLAKRRPAILSLPEYALRSDESNKFSKTADELDNLRFGFFGEVGGLLAAVKRSVRDQVTETQSELAGEELGDALWYLFGVAKALKISPDALGESCIKHLRDRSGETAIPPTGTITFANIDGVLDSRHGQWDVTRTIQLGVLANAAGTLAHTAREQLLSMALPVAVSHLGKILSEWALACSVFELRTEDVARDNLGKVSDRWPSTRIFHPFFDSEDYYEEHERFPRKFSIEFIERGSASNPYVVQRLRGVNIGDRLTDNNNKPDGYRFHDVFHLAYIAFLGWSPVLRGLLKLKRKSIPSIDENQDGARAMIIEEGIATWIFNHANHRQFYKDISVGKLDFSLLKQIRSMVDGYEVEACPLWQWELAILSGFDVFRQLLAHRGGLVTVDMIEHSLTFQPPSYSKK